MTKEDIINFIKEQNAIIHGRMWDVMIIEGIVIILIGILFYKWSKRIEAMISDVNAKIEKELHLKEEERKVSEIEQSYLHKILASIQADLLELKKKE